MCITVRVHYSPSRAIDVPWGDYLYLRHKGEQERRRAALGGLADHMPTWKYKTTYREEGGVSITQRWFISHKWDILTVVIPVALLLITYVLLSHPLAVPLANRYWVGLGGGVNRNWNRTQNWSASSGGAGSAGVPTGADAVIFDTNSDGADCLVDIDAACLSFTADSNYTKDFDTQGFNLTVTNAFSYAGTGTFTHGSGDISVGTFSYTGAGSFANFGFVESGGSFTATGTWSDNGGTIDIDGTGTWNASLTTTVLEWDAPNGTITVTGGNTIVVVDTLILLGNSGNPMTITAAANFTIDLGASISVKTAIHCDIDHMQLGAGDTLIVFSGTDNGNNDADITFSAFDRVANASGAFDDNAKWDGGNAPVSGVSFDIPNTITMTIQGNEASAGGGVSGTLTFDGQADSAVAQLTIDGGDVLEILSGGVMDTTGTGSTGYAKILSSDANDVHCHGEGTVTLGSEFHFDTVHITHGTIANSEKVVLDGDCEWHDGFVVASGGEMDDGGNTLTVENGNLTIASGGYTATGTLILAGTHSLDGAGLSFNILQVGTSPGVTTLEANLEGVDLTIAGGDELDTNTFNVTMTGNVVVTGTYTGSTGTHSHGSLTFTGTYSQSTGTTTITDDTAAGWAFDNDGGTLINNSGTFTITTGTGTKLEWSSGTGNPYNLIINTTAGGWIAWVGNSTIDNDFTLTDGNFRGNTNGNTLTVTGDALITADKLGNDGSTTAALTFGSLTISSGGTYEATSGTTTITSETAGGRCVSNNGGTYTGNSGILRIETATATLIRLSTGAYNLEIAGGNTVGLTVSSLTTTNYLSIEDGTLDTVTFALTINGTTTIGDGVGAASSAQLVCNSSAVDLNGTTTIDSDGEFSLPDSSGSLNIDGDFENDGVVTANGGTVTFDITDTRVVNKNGAVDPVFYNVTLIATIATKLLNIRDVVTVESALLITTGKFRLNAVTKDATLRMGTTSSVGTITNNDTFTVIANTVNTASIVSVSEQYPFIFTGNDISWDDGGAGSMLDISDMDYRIAATTGGGGVTITMTRCLFPLGMHITTGDTVKIAGNTASGFLKVEGDGTLQIVRGGGVFTVDGIGDPGPQKIALPTVLNPPNIVPRFIEGVES